MKRGIAFLCASLSLVFCLAVPAEAADISNDLFFNVLSYSFPNDGNSLYAYVKSGDTVTFSIPITTFAFVDMVIRSDLTGLSASCNGFALTVERFTSDQQGYIYRIYGQGNFSGGQLSLTFNFSSGSLIVFESLHCSSLIFNDFDISADFEINTPAFQGTLHHDAGASMTYKILPGNPNHENNFFYSYFWSSEWTKYDFLDFYFMLDCSQINSVTAVMGSSSVPLDVSIVENGNFNGEYFVTVRLDLRGLDRSSTDYPMIIVSGTGVVGQTWSIACMSASGLIVPATADSESFNLLRIFSAIKSGFADIGKAISDFQVHWTDYFMDSMTDLNNNIGNFDNHFTAYTKKVKEWISDQTTSITNWFLALNNNIIGEFSSLKTSLSSWIQSQTDSIVSAIKGDPSAGNEFQSGVGEKKDQMDQMIGVMGSVNKPDLGSFDLSGAGVIDQNIMLTSMSGLSAVIKDPIFLPIITLSLTLATAAYVLFGKR